MISRATRFAALRQAHRFPWQAMTAGTVLATLGVLTSGLYQPLILAALASALVVPAAPAWWWIRWVARPQYTAGVTHRDGEERQRAGGVASWVDVQEHASPAALRTRAGILRPSLAGVKRPHPTELGCLFATTGAGRLPGQQVWTAYEDVTLSLGGTRTGKSAALAEMGLTCPGALITTSTRLDLAEAVHLARRVRPVHVLNLGRLGGTDTEPLPSNIRWSVLTGCTDYATAARRAADLMPEDKSNRGDSLDWHSMGRNLLGLLLHAAALSGRRARDVIGWVNAKDESSPPVALVADILGAVPGGGLERVAAWRQHWAQGVNTRKSVVSAVEPALAWLSDDHARPLGDADPADVTLDIPRLITGRETLHLLGHEDATSVAPLIAAIVAEVSYQARQLASRRPGGRLDPPLTMLLDEAAIIVPVPLDRWTADMGGRNITVHISIQSLSQMRDRWGDNGAGAILGNVGAVRVFGGCTDARDLRELSTLAGERRQKILDADGKQDIEAHEHRWVPVMAPDQIRTLRTHEVLVLRRSLRAVIGWAPKPWDRPDWQPLPLPGDPRLTGGAPAGARTAGRVPWWADRGDGEPEQVDEPQPSRTPAAVAALVRAAWRAVRRAIRRPEPGAAQ